MKKREKAFLLLSLGAAALLVCGCGSKKVETTEVPKEPVAQEGTKAEAPPSNSLEKYVVKDGDTLWAISNQTRNYSDSFQWPLIFKTNRDQIQDPDQITPGQVLVIQRGQSAEQTSHTRQLASDTPGFKAHVGPRETLPVNYF